MLNEIYHRPYYIIALLIAPSTLNISRATVFLGSLEYVSEFLCHITNYVFSQGLISWKYPFLSGEMPCGVRVSSSFRQA